MLRRQIMGVVRLRSSCAGCQGFVGINKIGVTSVTSAAGLVAPFGSSQSYGARTFEPERWWSAHGKGETIGNNGGGSLFDADVQIARHRRVQWRQTHRTIW
jgi:hypothetical protein